MGVRTVRTTVHLNISTVFPTLSHPDIRHYVHHLQIVGLVLSSHFSLISLETIGDSLKFSKKKRKERFDNCFNTTKSHVYEINSKVKIVVTVILVVTECRGESEPCIERQVARASVLISCRVSPSVS